MSNDNLQNENKQTEQVGVNFNNFVKNLNKKTVLIIIVLLIGGLFVYSNYISAEGIAKGCVNNYLGAIKNGESTSDYRSTEVDDFINVLDYKFLSVKEQTKEKKVLTFEREDWKDYWSKTTDAKDFIAFKNEIKGIYSKGETIEDNLDRFTVSTGEYYNQVVLLYDVNLTNKLGQSLFKKVQFTVNNDNAFNR